MAHIYIVSPSSVVRDKAAFRRGVKRLHALGHEVELDEAALSRFQRFAGDDETRLKALERAAQSRANVVLISRGGYGLTRLLPELPYQAIAQSIDNGTHWVGLSDFTALQLALLAKTGKQTWSGPALGADFGVAGEADEIMLACFDDLIVGHAEGVGWRLPLADRRWLATQKHPLDVTSGVLWGGNLCVLTALLGTPYFPAIKAGVLYLEDVNEHPYQIERMLTQLLLAGVLQDQQAICLGHFNQYQLSAYDGGFNLQKVIDRLRQQCATPVLTGLPFGHVTTKVLLPTGAVVKLQTVGKEAYICGLVSSCISLRYTEKRWGLAEQGAKHSNSLAIARICNEVLQDTQRFECSKTCAIRH